MQSVISKLDFNIPVKTNELKDGTNAPKDQAVSFKSVFKGYAEKEGKNDLNKGITKSTGNQIKKNFYPRPNNSNIISENTDVDTKSAIKGSIVIDKTEYDNWTILELLNLLVNYQLISTDDAKAILDGYKTQNGNESNIDNALFEKGLINVKEMFDTEDLKSILTKLSLQKNDDLNFLNILQETKGDKKDFNLLDFFMNMAKTSQDSENAIDFAQDHGNINMLEFLDSKKDTLVNKTKLDSIKDETISKNFIKEIFSLFKKNGAKDSSDILKSVLEMVANKLSLDKSQLLSLTKDISNYDTKSFTTDIFLGKNELDKAISDSDGKAKDFIKTNSKSDSLHFTNSFHFDNLVKVDDIAKAQKIDQSLRLSIINQIVSKMSIIHKESLTTLTVSLKPEWLGNVMIELNRDINGNINGSIYVNNPHVKEVVEGSLSNLLTILKDQGLNISQLNVSLSNNSNDQSFQNNQRFNQRDFYMTKEDDNERSIGSLIYEITESYLNLQA